MFTVTAMSIDPATGAMTGKPRSEDIDPATNVLFEGCMSPWEIEDAYLDFWNRLNASWERSFPAGKDKVVVLSVLQR